MQINKEFFRKLLPHVIAILFFAVLTMVYFSPVFKGKEIKTHDFHVWRSSAEEIINFKKETGETSYWTNTSFSGMPTYLISPQRDKVIVYIQKALNVWSDKGMNMVFIYLLGFYFALLLLGVRPWLSIAGAVAFAFSSYFFIIIQAGHETKAFAIGYMPLIISGAYIAFKNKPYWGSLLMALALAIQIRINHFQITYYTGLAVLVMVLIFFIQAIKDKKIKEFIKPALLSFVGLILAIGVNITSFYTTYEYGKYSIRGKSELTQHNGENKTSGLDKDYATAWSYDIDETLTFLIPNFKGGASGGSLDENSEMFRLFEQSQGKAAARKVVQHLPLYWGTQPMTSGPVYIGAIICFLFILGLFLVKGNVRTWLVSITIMSVVLGWGRNLATGDFVKYGLILSGLILLFKDFYNNGYKNLNNKKIIISGVLIAVGFVLSAVLPNAVYNNPFSYYVLDYFPGYNKFRTVSMILIIAEFSMPLLGIIAVSKILNNEISKTDFHKALYWSVGITAGISLLVALFSNVFSYSSVNDSGMQQVIVDALRADRQHLLKVDAFRSFAFIMLSAVLLWAVFNKKIKQVIFYPVFIALILFDMYPVDKRYLNESHYVTKKQFKQQFEPTQADKFILQDKDLDYRVLNLAVSTFNDATTSHYHKSIGGYHGAKMRRYQELIDFHISKEIQNIAQQLNAQKTMEGVSNVIGSNKILNMLNTRYVILNPQGAPILNNNAMGNAWFVKNVDVVDDANQEINKLYSFNPKEDAVVNNKFEKYLSELKPKIDTNATIKLNEYKPNYLQYTSNSKGEQLAVFSEIYYPKGWHAFIDGKPVDYIQANYVLRAMIIPEGEHVIEWRFNPKSIVITESISVASSLLLIFMALGLIGFNIYKSRRVKE